MGKERYQLPTSGDVIFLRQRFYNSNNLADVSSIDSVNLYLLDPSKRTDDNPDGRVLIETIQGTAVQVDGTGLYRLDLTLDPAKYIPGKYVDSWNIVFLDGQDLEVHESLFVVYSNLWMVTPTPIIYDFSFKVTPSRIVRGSIKYLTAEITPLVPNYSDLVRFYRNLALVADVSLYMSQTCGACLPKEKDLRLVLDGVSADSRENCRAYFKIDTTDMACGIYDVWFKMIFGECIYISEKSQIQIHD